MDRNNFTLEDMADALMRLNESDREVWIHAGMALKSEFGDSGFAVWNDWSQGYAKYKPYEAVITWRSFRKSGISLGTLVKLAMDNGWTPRQRDAAELKRLSEEAALRRVQVEDQFKKAELAARILRDEVGVVARQLVGMLPLEGKSPYLARKKVAGFGLRYVSHGVVVVTDEQHNSARLITGKDEVCEFLNRHQNLPEDSPISFKYLRPGAVVLPLRDQFGSVQNVQIIWASGKKSFLKGGMKSGLFGVIEADSDFDRPLLGIAEGYSTAASVRMAVGCEVWVAIDCGNLPLVAKLARKAFPDHQILLAADDDAETEGNPGLTKAIEAAALIEAYVAKPDFSGEMAA